MRGKNTDCIIQTPAVPIPSRPQRLWTTDAVSRALNGSAFWYEKFLTMTQALEILGTESGCTLFLVILFVLTT